jgi:hypothetical protein
MSVGRLVVQRPSRQGHAELPNTVARGLADLRGPRLGNETLIVEPHVDAAPTHRVRSRWLLCSGYRKEQLDV